MEYAEDQIRVNSNRRGFVGTSLQYRFAEHRPDTIDQYEIEKAIPRREPAENLTNVLVFLGSKFSARVTGDIFPADGEFLLQVQETLINL